MIGSAGGADRSTVGLVGAERQSGAVARPAGDHRPAAGLQPGRNRAGPRPDPDRDRAGAKGSRTRSARGCCRCCSIAKAIPTRRPPSATKAAVKASRRDDIVGFQQRWLRPDNLEIFVVSNLPLAEVQPLLEQRFGTWQAPAVAKGVKKFIAPPARPTAERIVLVDRPGSPQSIILAGQVTPIDPRSEIVAISGANDILGGNFLSRINMDLRETKGWSYGVQGSAQLSDEAGTVHRQRAGSGRPHRRIRSRRCRRTSERSSGTKGVTEEELRADHRQSRRPIAGPVRDRRRGPRRDANQCALRPARQLLRAARRQVSRANHGNVERRAARCARSQRLRLGRRRRCRQGRSRSSTSCACRSR